MSFSYDNGNRLLLKTLPNGVGACYGWSIANELTALTYYQGTLTSCTSPSAPVLGTLTYAYDGDGRLASRSGSLFQSQLAPTVTAPSYDNANRLTSWTTSGSSISPVWDKDGELTYDGTQSITWNSRRQLTQVGSTVFGYDMVGRRRGVYVGSTSTYYVYDGWNEVQEVQGGSASANLLTGLGMDVRYSRTKGAVTLTFIADGLGSTMALAGSGRTIATNYGYGVYGNNPNASGSANDNPYQFTGRMNDGTGYDYYRNRYYAPAWGRFVSEDPIGYSAYDPNLYRYAHNAPHFYTDRSGICIEDLCIVESVIVIVAVGYIEQSLAYATRCPPPPKPDPPSPTSCSLKYPQGGPSASAGSGDVPSVPPADSECPEIPDTASGSDLEPEGPGPQW